VELYSLDIVAQSVRHLPFREAVPLIIRRDSGGFFSQFWTVLYQVKIARDCGLVPVVDFSQGYCEYRESFDVFGTRNPWEYYFEQIGGSLLDLAKGEEFYLTDVQSQENLGGWRLNASTRTELQGIYKEFIKLNDRTMRHIESEVERFAIGPSTLGVHFRGRDMRYAPHHPTPMTLGQCKKRISRTLDSQDFDSILLVTEGQEYVDFFRKAFGTRLSASNSYREKNTNAYNSYPRKNHLYLLGLEALTDGQLLSLCGGLVCSKSNLSNYSIFCNNENYKTLIEVDNGLNSKSKKIARFQWNTMRAFRTYGQ